MGRFPFPIPFGWYQVCYPDDLGAEPLSLRYFGRELVAWRDESGEAHVMDAYCPHLGAHLGVGGKIEGDTIVCPFHAWKFDGTGACVDIPYSDRLNRKARVRTYPAVERNGMTFAWYHPSGEEPLFDVPAVPELDDPAFQFHDMRSYVVRSIPQEMGENIVDPAHFRFVHTTDAVPEVKEYVTDGYTATMISLQRFPTPRGVVDGHIDVYSYGPGFGYTWFTGIVDTLLVNCTTPIDDDHTEVRFHFYVRKLGDAESTSNVGKAFVAEVNRQMSQDIPIWENKTYLPVPALADTDGPFMQYRKWISQFYADAPPEPAREPVG